MNSDSSYLHKVWKQFLYLEEISNLLFILKWNANKVMHLHKKEWDQADSLLRPQ